MSFVVWFDPSKKVNVLDKATNAIDNYRFRRLDSPKVLLVSEATHRAMGEPLVFQDVPVEVAGFVADQTFYVGEHDAPPGPVRARTAISFESRP